LTTSLDGEAVRCFFSAAAFASAFAAILAMFVIVFLVYTEKGKSNKYILVKLSRRNFPKFSTGDWKYVQ
jgi:hypothetical protein